MGAWDGTVSAVPQNQAHGPTSKRRDATRGDGEKVRDTTHMRGRARVTVVPGLRIVIMVALYVEPRPRTQAAKPEAHQLCDG